MIFFNEKQTIVIASAPGRLDVMGGIADYSGSWVLQMPIREEATAQVAFREDGLLRVFSENIGSIFEIPLAEMPLEYTLARQIFIQEKEISWAAYPIGCLLVLAKEKGISLRRGIDIYVKSDVPIGKGISSSAALELATMRALQKLYSIDFQATEMACLAQMAENLVAGSPCGLMDQLTSAFGQIDHLLPIKCQPDLLLSLMPLPEGIHFVGLDSGVRHSVSGASYTDVRTAAFMGYSIIATAAGIGKNELIKMDRQELPYGGYLCNLTVEVFEEKYKNHLPSTMVGAEFLNKFSHTIDPVTKVEPTKFYQIKNCTEHPVYENARVLEFMELFRQPDLSKASCRRLGELMYQSHESYSLCGLGNERTDELVEMVKAAGPLNGVFGAKITGGGSGGTVCVLCRGEEGVETAKRIFGVYRAQVGMELKFIS